MDMISRAHLRAKGLKSGNVIFLAKQEKRHVGDSSQFVDDLPYLGINWDDLVKRQLCRLSKVRIGQSVTVLIGSQDFELVVSELFDKEGSALEHGTVDPKTDFGIIHTDQPNFWLKNNDEYINASPIPFKLQRQKLIGWIGKYIQSLLVWMELYSEQK